MMSHISKILNSITPYTKPEEITSIHGRLNQIDSSGNHALLAAIKEKNFSLAEYIILKGGRDLITLHKNFNFSPLDYAIANIDNKVKALKLFIKYLGDHINSRFSITVIGSQKCDKFMTPLRYAIYERNEIAIRCLVAYGAKLHKEEQKNICKKMLNKIQKIQVEFENEKQHIKLFSNEVLHFFPSCLLKIVISYVPPPSHDQLTP